MPILNEAQQILRLLLIHATAATSLPATPLEDYLDEVNIVATAIEIRGWLPEAPKG